MLPAVANISLAQRPLPRRYNWEPAGSERWTLDSLISCITNGGSIPPPDFNYAKIKIATNWGSASGGTGSNHFQPVKSRVRDSRTDGDWLSGLGNELIIRPRWVQLLHPRLQDYFDFMLYLSCRGDAETRRFARHFESNDQDLEWSLGSIPSLDI